jgi:TRAP-type mannitol/chloroaromatic compound transport system permease large subunit
MAPTLNAVQDLTAAPSASSAEQPSSLRQHLARCAFVVVVLGILPFSLDAPTAWQAIGALVSLALVARGLQLTWRAVFSTDPRHLVQG